MTYYITFGQTHTHRIPNHTLDKDCVLAVEAESQEAARKKVFELFGPKWSMFYDKKPDMSYFPRGIITLE